VGRQGEALDALRQEIAELRDRVAQLEQGSTRPAKKAAPAKTGQ
jgi:hypothetical protein